MIRYHTNVGIDEGADILLLIKLHKRKKRELIVHQLNKDSAVRKS